MAEDPSVGPNAVAPMLGGPVGPAYVPQGEVRVRRGRVQSVDIYEIKDIELDQLERGSPVDLQLNFAIFLLSLAFSGTCTLATATFDSKIIADVVVVVTVVGVLMGLFLVLSWIRNRSSLKTLCAGIRQRIPPDIAAAPSTASPDMAPRG
jgi:hypothetical protein